MQQILCSFSLLMLGKTSIYTKLDLLITILRSVFRYRTQNLHIFWSQNENSEFCFKCIEIIVLQEIEPPDYDPVACFSLHYLQTAQFRGLATKTSNFVFGLKLLILFEVEPPDYNSGALQPTGHGRAHVQTKKTVVYPNFWAEGGNVF